MRQCVKQFDNDLCIKANKQSLLELEKAVDDKYTSKKGLAVALADLQTVLIEKELAAKRLKEEFEAAQKSIA